MTMLRISAVFTTILVALCSTIFSPALASAFTFGFTPSITRGQERGTTLFLPSVTSPGKAPYSPTLQVLHFRGVITSNRAITRDDDHHVDHNDDDDDEIDCLPPGRRPEPKYIFVISDSTGVTARSAMSKCLVQFGSSCDERFQSTNTVTDTKEDNFSLDDSEVDDCNVQTKVYTFIRSEEAVATIVKKTHELQAFVVFTIADPILREKTLRMCALSNTPVIDLLGPSLNALSSFLGRTPTGLAGSHETYDSYGHDNGDNINNKRRRSMAQLSDIYFRRIEAIEFTLCADDGQAPWLLPQADVIIVGVSRTGKTPLSVLLSQQMGLKVANIPLVLEVAPPKELLDQNLLDSKRIFCLTIAPTELKRIRTTRLARSQVFQLEEKRSSNFAKTRSSGTNIGVNERGSNYNSRAYLLKDLRNAKDLSTKYKWTQIDVTGRAVEETAGLVSELMNERFQDEV